MHSPKEGPMNKTRKTLTRLLFSSIVMAIAAVTNAATA
jgi:hypothetical protein